jgi:hypothetical protein
MDWLILIFLVPLVLIPLVFLMGFAGCDFKPNPYVPPDPPAAPSNLVATPVSSSEIDLTWTDNAATSTTAFKIARSENGGPWMDPTSPANPPPTPGAMQQQWKDLEDSSLNPGTPYEYQVFAIVSGETSAGTNMAPATTFAEAYNVPLTTDDPGLEGRTIVQRIDAGHIISAGAKVRLTLRGSTGGNLIINKVTISQPATAGHAWDSAGVPIEVHFNNGQSGVTIPANATQANAAVSDVTNYNLVLGQDLFIAFDISTTDGSARRATMPGPTQYFKPNTAEAAVQIRSANYQTFAGRVSIIEKIEVVP